MCVFELNTLTHIATPAAGAGMRGVHDDDERIARTSFVLDH